MSPGPVDSTQRFSTHAVAHPPVFATRIARAVRIACLLLGALCAIALEARAQDIRGSIAGTITDSAGGVLVGATVTIENRATGVTRTQTTNDAGLFTALFLPAGEYKVTVAFDGFRPAVRERVELRVEDRVTLDLRLEPAGAVESLEVSAEAPLLETRTATSGQVIDSKTIEEMPLGDGTAYFLARLAPGVEFTADPRFTRPMDNVNLAGVSASGIARSGAPGENNDFASTEFMIDGVPNHVSQNRLGFSPPSAAVQEFKVSTSVFDAQYGQGTGGTVNLGLKSGTNQFRGEASYYNRDESRTANTFFANRLGQAKERRDYHRATTFIGGPIRRNKTFFIFSAEYLYDDAPEPTIVTVPTEKMRNGDFSEYPNVVIYDPFSSRREPDGRGGTRVVRDPFPGNRIPADRLHPIAQTLLSYYPLPNLPRDQWRADGTGNYFSNRNRPYDYRGMVTKVDHTINEANRTFVNFFRNWRMEDRNNWATAPITQGFDWRTNTGGMAGWTSLFSASTVLDVRVSAHRFGEWQRPALVLSAADMGFNERFQALARGYPMFPRIDMETYQDIGTPRPAGRYAWDKPHERYAFLPTLTRVSGRHSLRAGYDLRLVRESEIDEGYKGGTFTFRSGTTNQGTGATGSNTHRDLAGLLLAAPTGGSFATDVSRHNRIWYHGAFVQDDWRVSNRLTINAGLRWEMETGMVERDNRNVRGFDFTSDNPIEAAARAQLARDYAANPAAFAGPGGRPLVTPESFQVNGGYLFASEQNRDMWRAPKNNFEPRIGAAYQATDKLVVRAGWGMFMTPYILSGIDQRGFSRSTDMRLTDAQDLPRRGIFEDPLAGGGILDPLGASGGFLTSLGQGVGGQDNTVVPYDRDVQMYHRYQAGFQYELPLKTLLEINYVASRGTDLIVARPLNFLPADYLIDSVTRDRAAEDFLGASVPNPFRGLPEVRGTDLDRDTISRQNLLRAFPQFTTFRVQEHSGSNRYDSMQLRLERRFSKGVMVSGNYTYARLMERITFDNESDAAPSERVGVSERPHSYKIATVIELPFGRDRKWGASWGRWMDAVAGGWRLSANWLWQSGQPITYSVSSSPGNPYYDPARNPFDLRSMYGTTDDGRRYGIDLPAWDVSGFYFHDAPVQTRDPVTGQLMDDPARQIADDRIVTDNTRYRRLFPYTIDGMRQPPFFNLDIGIGKTFAIGHMRLQVRAEAFNATNSPMFGGLNVNPRSGNFGRFDSQRNLPRDIQLGARLQF